MSSRKGLQLAHTRRARKRRRRRAAATTTDVFSSRLCALTIYASAILSSFRSALLLARESLDRTIFFSSFLFAESSRVPLLDLFTFLGTMLVLL